MILGNYGRCFWAPDGGCGTVSIIAPYAPAAVVGGAMVFDESRIVTPEEQMKNRLDGMQGQINGIQGVVAQHTVQMESDGKCVDLTMRQVASLSGRLCEVSENLARTINHLGDVLAIAISADKRSKILADLHKSEIEAMAQRLVDNLAPEEMKGTADAQRDGQSGI